MPAYAYTGLNASGKSVKGIESADNLAGLKSSLKRKGIFLTSVNESAAAAVADGVAQASGFEIDFSKLLDRITPTAIAWLTRLLSTLLSAGVTLPDALDALIDQVESPRLKGILGSITSKVKEGSSLADAMSAYPKHFSLLYLNMVRAGEASGSLEIVLMRVAEFMEQQDQTRSKVQTAMFYPVAMGIIGALVVSLLMMTVVPQISQMFEDQGTELPLITKLLLGISDFLAGFWWLVIALVAAAIWQFRRWRAGESGRRVTDRWLLDIWVIGDLVRKIAVSRFARTLATLLASGVQLLAAMEIVRPLLGNAILEKVIEQARDAIREGQGIAPALKKSGEFPPLVTHMIAVGERSGQLEQMLKDVADAYDRETNAAITRSMALLEPLMILLMGGGVLFIVLAIMTPIFQMNTMASQ